MEVYAKKLREFYIREGVIPDDKIYIDTLRDRQPEDTIERCVANKEVAGLIKARDEFKEIDLVFPWNAPYLIKRQAHHAVRPFYIRHNDEEIRVTMESIDTHFKREYPYFMNLQRYIVGRPNLLKLPIYPVQEDKSLHWQAGANFMFLTREVYVWSYNDSYPARIEVDCQNLTPSYPIKIGDIEKMLPYGIYLHKMYDHQKFTSVVKLKNTNLYQQRKNMIVEQADMIKD